ncbi:uncharacterized protein LOC128241428 [Mya arenaria]|uniref:uncharacterized protein LOC128241428 n=1 Tax=Mya arenaria TaxID=6604 RepID=UPI0022E69A50|nr:uncharacterized protein LOC128241428 [Mya arenaria]
MADNEVQVPELKSGASGENGFNAENVKTTNYVVDSANNGSAYPVYTSCNEVYAASVSENYTTNVPYHQLNSITATNSSNNPLELASAENMVNFTIPPSLISTSGQLSMFNSSGTGLLHTLEERNHVSQATIDGVDMPAYCLPSSFNFMPTSVAAVSSSSHPYVFSGLSQNSLYVSSGLNFESSPSTGIYAKYSEPINSEDNIQSHQLNPSDLECNQQSMETYSLNTLTNAQSEILALTSQGEHSVPADEQFGTATLSDNAFRNKSPSIESNPDGTSSSGTMSNFTYIMDSKQLNMDEMNTPENYSGYVVDSVSDSVNSSYIGNGIYPSTNHEHSSNYNAIKSQSDTQNLGLNVTYENANKAIKMTFSETLETKYDTEIKKERAINVPVDGPSLRTCKTNGNTNDGQSFEANDLLKNVIEQTIGGDQIDIEGKGCVNDTKHVQENNKLGSMKLEREFSNQIIDGFQETTVDKLKTVNEFSNKNVKGFQEHLSDRIDTVKQTNESPKENGEGFPGNFSDRIDRVKQTHKSSKENLDGLQDTLESDSKEKKGEEIVKMIKETIKKGTDDIEIEEVISEKNDRKRRRKNALPRKNIQGKKTLKSTKFSGVKKRGRPRKIKTEMAAMTKTNKKKIVNKDSDNVKIGKGRKRKIAIIEDEGHDDTEGVPKSKDMEEAAEQGKKLKPKKKMSKPLKRKPVKQEQDYSSESDEGSDMDDIDFMLAPVNRKKMSEMTKAEMKEIGLDQINELKYRKRARRRIFPKDYPHDSAEDVEMMNVKEEIGEIQEDGSFKRPRAKNFVCNICEKKYSRASRLIEHIRSHTGERPFQCEMCGAAFRAAKTLEQHMKVHSGVKPFHCNVCGNRFAQVGNLQRHMRTHTSERPFLCTYCGFAFKEKNHLQGHIRIHTGEKPYKCTECDQSFAVLSTLNSHVRTHSGLRPHSCKYCGKKFARRNSLMEHVGLHEGQHHPCQDCGKIFHHERALKAHLKIHTEGRPWECPQCNKRFSRRRNMIRHTSVHNGGMPLPGLSKKTPKRSTIYPRDYDPDDSPPATTAAATATTLSSSLVVPPTLAAVATSAEISKTFIPNVTLNIPQHQQQQQHHHQQNLLIQPQLPGIYSSALSDSMDLSAQINSYLYDGRQIISSESQQHQLSQFRPDQILYRPQIPGQGVELQQPGFLGHKVKEGSEIQQPRYGYGSEIWGVFDNSVVDGRGFMSEIKDYSKACDSNGLESEPTYKSDTEFKPEQLYKQDASYKQDADYKQDTAYSQDTAYKQDLTYKNDDVYNDDSTYKSVDSCEETLRHKEDLACTTDISKHSGDENFDKTLNIPKIDCSMKANENELNSEAKIQESDVTYTDDIQTEEIKFNIKKVDSGKATLKDATAKKKVGRRKKQGKDKSKGKKKKDAAKAVKKEPEYDGCSSGNETVLMDYDYETEEDYDENDESSESDEQSKSSSKESHLEDVRKKVNKNIADKLVVKAIAMQQLVDLKTRKRAKKRVFKIKQEYKNENLVIKYESKDSDIRDPNEEDVEKSGTKTVIKRPRARNFVCEICNKRYSKSARLVEHIRIHTGERPYQCELCGSAFRAEKTLEQHMRVHSGEKPFNCNVCGNKFAQVGNLQRHMRTHTAERPFLCTYCGFAFKEKNHLQGHMRIHTGEKPFKCTECDKQFAVLSTLNSHLKTHTGDKPFACEFCDKKFARRRGLTEHLRVHTGNKLVCSTCNTTFTHKSSYNTHIKTHAEGGRPFTCDICGKTFARDRHLQKHKDTHNSNGRHRSSTKKSNNLPVFQPPLVPMAIHPELQNSNLSQEMPHHNLSTPELHQIDLQLDLQNQNELRNRELQNVAELRQRDLQREIQTVELRYREMQNVDMTRSRDLQETDKSCSMNRTDLPLPPSQQFGDPSIMPMMHPHHFVTNLPPHMGDTPTWFRPFH